MQYPAKKQCPQKSARTEWSDSNPSNIQKLTCRKRNKTAIFFFAQLESTKKRQTPHKFQMKWTPIIAIYVFFSNSMSSYCKNNTHLYTMYEYARWIVKKLQCFQTSVNFEVLLCILSLRNTAVNTAKKCATCAKHGKIKVRSFATQPRYGRNWSQGCFHATDLWRLVGMLRRASRAATLSFKEIAYLA